MSKMSKKEQVVEGEFGGEAPKSGQKAEAKWKGKGWEMKGRLFLLMHEKEQVGEQGEVKKEQVKRHMPEERVVPFEDKKGTS